MKKLLLSLGAVAAVAAPVAAVVACGNKAVEQSAVEKAQIKADTATLATYTVAIPDAKRGLAANATPADVYAALLAIRKTATEGAKTNALAAIAKIKFDDANKLDQVNKIVAEFVKTAGSDLLFNQSVWHKVFTFDSTGKVAWTQKDADEAPQTVADFESRTPRDKSDYEGLQDQVLEAAAAKILATA